MGRPYYNIEPKPLALAYREALMNTRDRLIREIDARAEAVRTAQSGKKATGELIETIRHAHKEAGQPYGPVMGGTHDIIGMESAKQRMDRMEGLDKPKKPGGKGGASKK